MIGFSDLEPRSPGEFLRLRNRVRSVGVKDVEGKDRTFRGCCEANGLEWKVVDKSTLDQKVKPS